MIKKKLLSQLATLKLNHIKQFIVAYSGGVDSHVLLHALKTTTDKFIQSIHINHGLSPHSLAWEKHCQTICADLKIPCQVIRVNAQPLTKESPEAAARDARYQAFKNALQPNQCLIMAHHQDDQAETFLLQLLRGAGVKGLACMPALNEFAAGYLWRPFLENTRQEILAYAEEHRLQWIHDESNNDTQFDRNYLRHQVLPLIKTRWPSVSKTISRSAKQCAEADQLLTQLAEQDLKKVCGKQNNTLSIAALTSLSTENLYNVLRQWFITLNLTLPNRIHLKHLVNDVIRAPADANPYLQWDGVELRRFRDDLYALISQEQQQLPATILWNLKNSLPLPNTNLHCRRLLGQGLNPLIIEQANKIEIRFRQHGERCHPVGRVGSHPLKKLFQEWEIPPWLRAQIPLLYIDEKLAAVVGYCICQGFAAQPNELGYWIGT